MQRSECPVEGSAARSPGSAILDLLREKLKINQSELARAMKVSRVRISQIIGGSAPISPAMALRLEWVSGVPANYWLGLQMAVDLERERHRLHDELMQLPRLDIYVRASEIQDVAPRPLHELGSLAKAGSGTTFTAAV